MPSSPDPLLAEMLELEAAEATDWDRVAALAAELQAGVASGALEDVPLVVHHYLADVVVRRSNRETGAEHFGEKQAEKVSRYLAKRQAAAAEA